MRREYSTTHPPLRLNKIVLLHRFAKDRLPAPRAFYETEVGKLSRPNRKGWCLANCPSHNSKSLRSFAINIETGAFRCWGCDSRGGDIVDFLQYRYNLSFKQACQQLGVWDQIGQPAPPTIPVRYNPGIAESS